MREILVAKLYDSAKIPTRKHPADAGLDLYACRNYLLLQHIPTIVGTGICVEIPYGYVGLIKPKSSKDFIIGGGVVDSGYTGEILVKITQTACEEVLIRTGDAIAQLLVIPIITPTPREVDKSIIQSKVTDRGGTGGIVTQNKLEFGNGWD